MANTAPPKVLLVEDDETLRLVTSAALRDAGFEVVEAKTGDEAILLLADPDDIDALFTDVRLPGTLDGIDLAHETRKIFPRMPVVIASGYAAQLTQRLRGLKPPLEFLRKPVSLEKIVATMRKMTEGL
jgi:DNA-binding NtrC family response regulator